ncbi:hypothetical protein LINGRAHAP2_LOCUS8031 [Linum grandiflorum]
MGSLLSHEIVLKQNSLVDESRGKKNIAFKASHKHHDSSDDETEVDVDKEITLMSNKLRRLLKFKKEKDRENGGSRFDKNYRFNNKLKDRNRREEDRSNLGNSTTSKPCYKCGRTCHLRVDCPIGKPNHKGLKASWSESEESESEDEEAGNNIKGLMALTDQEEEDSYEDDKGELLFQKLGNSIKAVWDELRGRMLR